MTDSGPVIEEADLIRSSWASQYGYRITLLLALVFSGIILTIQFPIFIYSPDGSFHAAKILRVMGGDYFTDPFTGVVTIYPSLFHFFYGTINRVLGFNPLQIVQLIVLIDFFSLFAAFYYCTSAFLKDGERVSLCVLSLSLVIYAPTSHYILIPQPSSFSFPFLLLSVGALYRYATTYSVGHLILGGILGSLAINIWWSNAFSFLAIVTVLAYYLVKNAKAPSPYDVAVFGIAFLIPCLYTAWHFYSVREILPFYLTDSQEKEHPEVLDVLTTWLITYLTKGNLPFLHHLNFEVPLQETGRTASILTGGTQKLHAIASIIHYFILVMPFHFTLVIYATVNLVRKQLQMHSRRGLLRTLAISGFAVLVCSSAMLFFVDVGHLRRVHFMISILFLLFAFTTAPGFLHSEKLRRLSRLISIAAIVALAYTVVYSPRLFTGGLPQYDSEVIQFVRTIEDRERLRVFMLGEGLRRVAPYVTLQSFVAAREGRYYHQDPKTASQLYQDFKTLKEKTDEWKNVAREKHIKWMILKTSEAAELEVLKQYENDGVQRYKNRDWVVLELKI